MKANLTDKKLGGAFYPFQASIPVLGRHTTKYAGAIGHFLPIFIEE